MSETIHEIPVEWKKRAFIDEAKYREMYARSVKDPDGFWGEIGKRLDWFKPYTKVKNSSFDLHRVSIKWYEDGVTNVAHNCIDRHLDKRGNQVAILWEGDDPKEDRRITYREMHAEVCKFANALKAQGDEAAEKAGGVQSMVVVRRTAAAVNMKPGRDHYYDELVKGVPADC